MESLFTRAMNLSHEAAASGRFEVAHHFLAAAAHLADDAQDDRQLFEALSVCQSQGLQVETEPLHNLSRARATGRGAEAVYESLARTITAMRARLHAKDAGVHVRKAAAHKVFASPSPRG